MPLQLCFNKVSRCFESKMKFAIERRKYWNKQKSSPHLEMNCKVLSNAALTSSEANLFALNFLSETKNFLSFSFAANLELSRQLKRVIWESIGVFLSWAEIQFHLKMLKQDVLVRGWSGGDVAWGDLLTLMKNTLRSSKVSLLVQSFLC